MEGFPDPEFLSVEGPEFVAEVGRADALVRRLEAANWDFKEVPEVLARSANCDVAAKEIVTIHDGLTLTRFGRLVMRGHGSRFNLMSHEPPTATFLRPDHGIFDELNRQVGSDGLNDFEEFRRFGKLQTVEFREPQLFYQTRDVVFWNVLHRTGLFPTGLEDVARQFAQGNVIRNLLFEPALRGDGKEPAAMVAHAAVSYPTPVVEWIPKPLYGGVAPETIHIETLLTSTPSKLSHPFLPLVAEGRAVVGNARYHMRRYAGVSPKDATRGPGVPEEGQAA